MYQPTDTSLWPEHYDTEAPAERAYLAGVNPLLQHPGQRIVAGELSHVSAHGC